MWHYSSLESSAEVTRLFISFEFITEDSKLTKYIHMVLPFIDDIKFCF